MNDEIAIDEKQFRELISKLDVLIKLNAASLFQGKPLTESVPFLSNLGLQPKEIARILGASPGAVRGTKSKARSKRKASRSKHRDKKGGQESVKS